MQAKLLRARMVLMEMSQSELAKRCGITENTLTNKLQGRTEFKADEIIKICEALNIKDAETRNDLFLT